MADKQFFPGFEGDDEPAKPAAPVPVAPAKKPVFDPFADVPATPAAAAEAPAGPAQAPAAKPAAPAARPPPPPPPAADDAELKPGSRKDLWKCPHCGTGNKPDRSSCRSCGKSQDEPVAVPWFKQPLILGGVIAAVVAVVVLLVVLTRTDLSMHEAGVSGIDKRPRIGGSGSEDAQLTGNLGLQESRQISVSGRVVALRPGAKGLHWVALALGPAAKDDVAFKDLAANKADSGGYEFNEGCVLLCAFPNGKAEISPGQFLSLRGETGRVVEEGRYWKELGSATAVKISEFQVK